MKSAMDRLDDALSKFDSRSGAVLALHAAVERELDIAIAAFLPNANRLRGLGFGHKVSLWAACSDLADHDVSTRVGALSRFNDLRNTIAHGDQRASIDKAIDRLAEYIPIVSRDEIALHMIAGYLFGIISAK